MYQYLSGTLTEKTPATAVIEAHGVGYLLQIPLSTYSSLPQTGQPVKLLAHFVVREDAQLLFGFYTEEERQVFRLLLSVSGVGPKTALTVLSGIMLADLKRAIIDGDLAVLTAVPGIGRKTAERMIVELREKVKTDDMGGAPADLRSKSNDPLFEDSLQALIELGYRKTNAQEALRKAAQSLEAGKYTVTDLIRASLKFVS